MAKSKKNTTSKSGNKSQVKTSPKKDEVKHTKAHSNKNVNATKDHAKTTKKADIKETKVASKTKKEDTKPQHVSESAVEQNNTWMIVSIILGVLILALVVMIGVIYLNQDNNKDNLNNETTNTDNQLNDNTNNDNVNNDNTNDQIVINDADKDLQIKLLVVEDPQCANCEVDLFAKQVKENLIPQLEVEKISFESQVGQTILTELNAKQVPVYLFSDNFDQRSDWAELEGAFIKVDANQESYYMLNPQFIPSKVMIQEPMVTDSAIIIGDKNAPVTLIEFTDYECPFCAIAEGNEDLVAQFSAQNPDYVPALPAIKKEYVETGKVRIVFYNMPIKELHPDARTAHLAGLCANEQNAFEEYSQFLWDKKSSWDTAQDRVEVLKGFAQELNLDTNQFNDCLDTQKYNDQIDQELALGREYGVSGTPGFFIGKTLISGAQDFSVFKQLIDAELAK